MFSFKEFVEKGLGTPTEAHRGTGIGYEALRRHIAHGTPLSAALAKRLAKWDQRIDPVKTLGLPDDEEGYSLREFVEQAIDGHNLTTVSRGAGLAYKSIYLHVRKGRPLRMDSVQQLKKWDARISMRKTLGV